MLRLEGGLYALLQWHLLSWKCIIGLFTSKFGPMGVGLCWPTHSHRSWACCTIYPAPRAPGPYAIRQRLHLWRKGCYCYMLRTLLC